MNKCDQDPCSDTKNPYPGPKYFTEDDKPFFFGREQEISYLGSRILANSVFLIYGASGTGKSSLVRAGLIPWLKNNNGGGGRLQRKDKDKKKILVIRLEQMVSEDVDIPKELNVFVALALNKLESESDQLGQKELAKICPSGESCHTFLSRLTEVFESHAEKGTRVLFFDQFEEFFNLYNERWADRQGFFEQIAKAIKKLPDLRIVFVMREDYLASMDDYARFLPGVLEARYHLTQLGADGARDAIVSPSTVSGCPPVFEDDAGVWLRDELQKETIVTAKGDETIEGEFVDTTILQIVCHDLWEEARKADEKTIKITRLEGKNENGHSPFQIKGCLSRYYRQALEKAAKKADRQGQETIVAIAEWIESKLTEGLKRKPYLWQDSEPKIQKVVLKSLKDSHLINALHVSGSGQGAAELIELIHDRWVAIARDECNRMRAPAGGWNFQNNESINEFINKLAYYVSREKKREKIAALAANPDDYHDYWIDVDSHNIGKDHFCLEVLEGGASFSVLPPESYEHLCEKSIEDVKKLRAYYTAKIQQTEDKSGLPCYYKACESLRSRAMDQRVKLPAADFKQVAKYINDKKLAGDLFYGNIISAVEKGDKESFEKLQKPLRITLKSEKTEKPANCFQAAIVMYFLSPTMMEKYNLQCIF